MIKHLRIDNRMIHGQVAITWEKYIGAKAIIVCNDKVAKDPIQKMALPLAAPQSKVLVFSIEDTLKYEKEHQDESIFVICRLPSDALAVLESGVEVETVNVGNAAPVAGTKYVMVTNQIAATAEDAAVYRKIAELRGGNLSSQMLANSEKHDFLAQLEKAGL